MISSNGGYSERREADHLFNLEITVIHVEGLPNEDISKFKNLSVELKLGGQVKEKQLLPNNQDPVSNEKFIFSFAEKSSQSLKCNVYNSDLPTKDQLLGFCSLQLDRISNGEEKTINLGLSKHNKTRKYWRKAKSV